MHIILLHTTYLNGINFCQPSKWCTIGIVPQPKDVLSSLLLLTAGLLHLIIVAIIMVKNKSCSKCRLQYRCKKWRLHCFPHNPHDASVGWLPCSSAWDPVDVPHEKQCFSKFGWQSPQCTCKHNEASFNPAIVTASDAISPRILGRRCSNSSRSTVCLHDDLLVEKCEIE